MEIDWWLLFREARVDAWHNVVIILQGIWSGFVEMLTSGDLFQTTLAIILIVAIVYTSWRTLFRLASRLTRYGAWDS